MRKVNDIADSIEFINGVATVTRNLAYFDNIGSLSWETVELTGQSNVYSLFTKNTLNPAPKIVGYDAATILCALYPAASTYNIVRGTIGIGMAVSNLRAYDPNYSQADSNITFKQQMQGVGLIYWIEPTTEIIQVSPFPISTTDTYTSANDTPYSAFEYKKNVEIWSCGEYNATDGKYHILVQPQGGSIADIALDEPLRKVNNVADTIEFADDVATLTRNFDSVNVSNLTFSQINTSTANVYRYQAELGRSNFIAPASSNTLFVGLCSLYNIARGTDTFSGSRNGIASTSAAVKNTLLYIYDSNYNGSDDLAAFVQHITGMELIYQCTPTTETIQVPQIEEADSYSCVISQGAKAVEWTSFTPNPE